MNLIKTLIDFYKTCKLLDIFEIKGTISHEESLALICIGGLYSQGLRTDDLMLRIIRDQYERLCRKSQESQNDFVQKRTAIKLLSDDGFRNRMISAYVNNFDSFLASKNFIQMYYLEKRFKKSYLRKKVQKGVSKALNISSS